MKVYLLGICCFAVLLISCKGTKQKAPENRPVKKATGQLVTDSVAPPVVTAVTPPKPLPVTVNARPFSLDPSAGREAITHITTADGLPPANYFQAEQDQVGNLWFNTGNNIIKYDGQVYTSYPLPQGISVFCYDMTFDQDNELWALIGREDSMGRIVQNLYIFNGVSFEPLPVMPCLAYPISEGILLYPQPDKRIWVVHDEKKLLLEFKSRQVKQTFSSREFSFKNINDIKTDQQGNTWITDAGDSSITGYDGKTFKKFTVADGLPGTYLRGTIPFSGDSLYVLTREGAYLYKGRESQKLNNYNYRTSLLDKQGTLWFFDRPVGGNFYKMSGTSITSIGRENGLDMTDLRSVGVDRDDNAWVLSQNVVNRLNKLVNTYTDIFPAGGFEQGIKSFYYDREGRYWFGSLVSGLSCYSGKTLTNYLFPVSGKGSTYNTSNNVLAIKQDPAGNIWLGTANSLVKFDGRSFFRYDESNGFDGKGVYVFLPDSKGNIWTADLSTGVNCFTGRERRFYGTAQGLCNNKVNSIFEDRSGALWFGTVNGLSRFQNGRFTTFRVADGLASNAIKSITGDKYGNLWLFTGAGISRFDGEKFINYPTEGSSNSSYAEYLRNDSVNQVLWRASNGLFTSIKIAANHPDSVVFETYSDAEGFPVKYSFDFIVDSTGALWTSEGNNSIKRFDYKKVKESSKPFNLHITQIRLNNETICWNDLKGADSLAMQLERQLRFDRLKGQNVWEQAAGQFRAVRVDSITPFDFVPHGPSLPYKANSISFDFAAIDPHFSKNTRYQYRLEGLDDGWSPLSRNNNANFGNLREGRYTFHLKALNPYGAWSEMSYSFTVRPPWQRTWWAYIGYLLAAGMAVYLFIRWRTRALQKEKQVLEEKVNTRTSELKESMEHLKATQSQLVQAEKMASLGELTAGIAHEIQNPLNFVNNFSEVNIELIEEVKSQKEKLKKEELEDLLDDIAANEEKINHHGKRADAIVKGMLQHSRSSSGQKEPTDINALCDEYLRLAYHGLRAKDNTFNAKLETDFDPAVGLIPIVPQDIGRVLLNLINNAFYTVNEREKLKANSQQLTASSYQPVVSVSTKKTGNNVVITVADNGSGIPQKVLDKIFQPFFTTKPTGQGTGLGLSLSYDIVKAHGGEIKVNTKENEGAEFIIFLPA